MIEQNANGLSVTGPMLIANASALLEAGRGFLHAGVGAGGTSEVVLDLSLAEETDSSALSVVFGLLRSARERGVKLRVSHPPASMISQATLYGVSDSLPLA
jgi:ABC-type transporter Mla MlaB component